MSDDITVYPQGERRLHNLYSPKCTCNPKVEVVGANLLILHNRLKIDELEECKPEKIYNRN